MRSISDKHELGFLGWLGLAVISILIFGPGLNNGFISDDYVFLQRVDDWLEDPLLLFGIPPENFRSTTYLAFLLLKSVFGYQPVPFYLFTILLHSLNALLAGRLAAALSDNPRVGWAASVIFVSFQNPQEAVLWLGGMHEALAGCFLLLCVLLWVRERPYWGLLVYGLALLSKESAPVALLLIPLTDWWRGRRMRAHPAYLGFLAMTGFYALIFLATAPTNSLIGGGFYSFTPRAALVLLRSLHELAFPWIYLALVAVGLKRLPFDSHWAWGALIWAIVALLPYIFLTYQDHVPSRHEYLASFAVAGFLAFWGRKWWRQPVGIALLILFVVSNGAYIWLVKDPQFERRAAPTNQLLRILESRPPQELRVESFPLNPWIGKLTARAVPGWQPSDLHVSPLDPNCTPCPAIRWDSGTDSYRPVDR